MRVVERLIGGILIVFGFACIFMGSCSTKRATVEPELAYTVNPGEDTFTAATPTPAPEIIFGKGPTIDGPVTTSCERDVNEAIKTGWELVRIAESLRAERNNAEAEVGRLRVLIAAHCPELVGR